MHTSPITEGWAGVGWVQDQDSGKGLFVEHLGASEEYCAILQIIGTLKSMMAARPEKFGDIQMEGLAELHTQISQCAYWWLQYTRLSLGKPNNGIEVLLALG